MLANVKPPRVLVRQVRRRDRRILALASTVAIVAIGSRLRRRCRRRGESVRRGSSTVPHGTNDGACRGLLFLSACSTAAQRTRGEILTGSTTTPAMQDLRKSLAQHHAKACDPTGRKLHTCLRRIRSCSVRFSIPTRRWTSSSPAFIEPEIHRLKYLLLPVVGNVVG